MTDAAKSRGKKIAKYGAIFGLLLALACHFVPRDYRQICETAAKLCIGG